MFIDHYGERDGIANVLVDRDLRQLHQRDRDKRAANIPIPLLVWQGALRTPGLDRLMKRRDWAYRLLEAMPPSPEWPWKMVSGQDELTDAAQIRDAIARACGMDGFVQGNVHVTLQVRRYDDRDDVSGGISWWQERAGSVAGLNEVGAAFMEAWMEALLRAKQAGSLFFSEQLSIIVSKDPGQPVATLTPTLHADQFYGERETAIASVLEAGWEAMGGALFLPNRRMSELWHLRPIHVERFFQDLRNETVLRSASGDVLLYDGMLDASGQQDKARGIPHVSSDVPGLGSRLCILMHHRATAAASVGNAGSLQ